MNNVEIKEFESQVVRNKGSRSLKCREKSLGNIRSWIKEKIEKIKIRQQEKIDKIDGKIAEAQTELNTPKYAPGESGVLNIIKEGANIAHRNSLENKILRLEYKKKIKIKKNSTRKFNRLLDGVLKIISISEGQFENIKQTSEYNSNMRKEEETKKQTESNAINSETINETIDTKTNGIVLENEKSEPAVEMANDISNAVDNNLSKVEINENQKIDEPNMEKISEEEIKKAIDQGISSIDLKVEKGNEENISRSTESVSTMTYDVSGFGFNNNDHIITNEQVQDEVEKKEQKDEPIVVPQIEGQRYLAIEDKSLTLEPEKEEKSPWKGIMTDEQGNTHYYFDQASLDKAIENKYEKGALEVTYEKEDGVKVTESQDGKHKMFDFSNVTPKEINIPETKSALMQYKEEILKYQAQAEETRRETIKLQEQIKEQEKRNAEKKQQLEEMVMAEKENALRQQEQFDQAKATYERTQEQSQEMDSIFSSFANVDESTITRGK